MTAVLWLLVVMLLGENPETMYFPSQARCNEARVEVVRILSETQQSSFGFSKAPYGAVSDCVAVPVTDVKRKA